MPAAGFVALFHTTIQSRLQPSDIHSQPCQEPRYAMTDEVRLVKERVPAYSRRVDAQTTSPEPFFSRPADFVSSFKALVNIFELSSGQDTFRGSKNPRRDASSLHAGEVRTKRDRKRGERAKERVGDRERQAETGPSFILSGFHISSAYNDVPEISPSFSRVSTCRRGRNANGSWA